MTYSDIFYEPPKGETSGLPHDPFKSFVIPRPIGWISTTSKDGQDNLGPYSQFTNVSFDPPTILFVGHQSVYKGRSKDSVVNAQETGEFVWNMPTYALRENVNQSALESWGDEFPISGVTKAPSRLVKPPRVAESPVSFECKVHSVVRIQGDSLVGHSDIVIGRVVGIHIKGEYITPDGLFDVLKAAPLARLGYHQYTAIDNVFEMKIPLMPDDFVSGRVLSGSSDKQKPKKVTPGDESSEIKN
ncbi:FMN-binding split barrel [Penicillium daleae]|uniref:FMN-binding split barrel n=1 Tax=Penicillium daleae TaxID=63821 RepID=A0AAD6G2U6_9EURO|nr:FMN-binding split barrel [Penicillium daleae]KAJ5453716.1 FMN-binding split barrel [Penicillium daleae]